MALVMTASGIIPIVICHLIVAGFNGFNPIDLLWYIPLLPVLMVINWFLSGIILNPLRQRADYKKLLTELEGRK